jgi:hypothetical protein
MSPLSRPALADGFHQLVARVSFGRANRTPPSRPAVDPCGGRSPAVRRCHVPNRPVDISSSVARACSTARAEWRLDTGHLSLESVSRNSYGLPRSRLQQSAVNRAPRGQGWLGRFDVGMHTSRGSARGVALPGVMTSGQGPLLWLLFDLIRKRPGTPVSADRRTPDRRRFRHPTRWSKARPHTQARATHAPERV